MPEFVLADGAVRFTQTARAVADASRELSSLREVRAVTADAVQRRACRLDQLIEELAHAPMRQPAWLRQALAEVADGGRLGTDASPARPDDRVRDARAAFHALAVRARPAA